VFSRWIMPSLRLRIMFQLGGAVIPGHRQVPEEEEGEEDHPVDPVPHRWSSRLFQGYGSPSSPSPQGAGGEPGWSFRIPHGLILTTGGVFVMCSVSRSRAGNRDGMSSDLLRSCRRCGQPRQDRSSTCGPARCHCSRAILLAVMVGVWRVSWRSRSGSAHPDPDPAQGDGPGTHPRRPEERHPDPDQFGRCDAVIFAQSIIIVPGTPPRSANHRLPAAGDRVVQPAERAVLTWRTPSSSCSSRISTRPSFSTPVDLAGTSRSRAVSSRA